MFDIVWYYITLNNINHREKGSKVFIKSKKNLDLEICQVSKSDKNKILKIVQISLNYRGKGICKVLTDFILF